MLQIERRVVCVLLLFRLDAQASFDARATLGGGYRDGDKPQRVNTSGTKAVISFFFVKTLSDLEPEEFTELFHCVTSVYWAFSISLKANMFRREPVRIARSSNRQQFVKGSSTRKW